MRAYAEVIGEVHIVMRSDGPDSIQRTDNLTVHGVQGTKILGLKKVASYARALVRAESIEVVSAQDPFEHGFLALFASRGSSAKLHIQIHTDFLSPWFIRKIGRDTAWFPFSIKNLVRRGIARVVLPKADGIRVVSKRIKQSLNRRYGKRIIEATILPIALEPTVPLAVELPRHVFSFTLITVGRLESEKRICDSIDALALIADIYPAIGLIIVGHGRERASLMTRVMEKNLVGRVVFAGANADAWGMMRNADVYIQASAYEGYGRTLLEAALACIPIISTDVGIVGDVLIPGEDMLVASPSDPIQLAAHISALYEERTLRERLAQHALQKAFTHTAQYTNLAHLIAEDLERVITTSPEP
jgi:glycosyltransferase involved in cell wall biosynthesis